MPFYPSPVDCLYTRSTVGHNMNMGDMMSPTRPHFRVVFEFHIITPASTSEQAFENVITKNTVSVII